MGNFELYICEKCGNIIEVVNKGDIDVVCCGSNAKKLVPNTVDAAFEKHVPVGTLNESLLEIKVGSVEHPMTNEHYIQSIYAVTDTGVVYRKYLNPGDKPAATFNILDAKKVDMYAYCNLHGLWKATIEI